MKQVIDGKAYNTETAQVLAGANSGSSRSDFKYWSERLYRTKKGTYFLAGEGGAMSHWSRSYPGGGSQGGEGIRVLTLTEAQEWVEKYANEQYEEIFGEAQEG